MKKKPKSPFMVAPCDRFRNGMRGDIVCVLLVNRATLRATVMTERANCPLNKGRLRIVRFATLAKMRRLKPRYVRGLYLPTVRFDDGRNSVSSAAAIARKFGMKP